MAVVAKFQVNEVASRIGGGTVKLGAVYPDDNDEKVTRDEDKKFWEATPAGSIELHINNAVALESFQPGDKHYVTFEEAE